MMHSPATRYSAAAAFMLSGLLYSSANFSQEVASNFPFRSVTIIVPFTPGGSNDPEVRRVCEKFRELLGQSCVVDFRAGAGSTIGTNYVAKSKPDGHTLLQVLGTFTTNAALLKDLPFDSVNDFAPVALMSKKPFILLVRPSFQVGSMSEYIAYARANPGKINWGTSGTGSLHHLMGEWLHELTGTKATFIHYKGTASAQLDLAGGRIEIAPTSIGGALPLVKSGKLRAIAITDDKRSPALPDVATVAEQGVAGYSVNSWLGYSAPATTPAAIVNKLNETFIKAMRSPDIAPALEAGGAILVGSTPAQFRALIVSEIERWKKIVKENGIRLEE